MIKRLVVLFMVILVVFMASVPLVSCQQQPEPIPAPPTPPPTPTVPALAPTPTPAPTPAPTPWSFQKVVGTIYSLHNTMAGPNTQDISSIPEHLLKKGAVKTGEEFNVNAYFSILTHLSMQSGYVLDYVYYRDWMKGIPVLYAREIDQTPYLTFSEYIKAEGEMSGLKTWNRVMERIQIDGTAEGFFEFIVLLIMGNQFYLDWHAAYNDRMIICNDTGLETALKALRDVWHGSLPSDVERKARTLDFQPIIGFEDDTVVVRIVVFTKWGGFIQESYTISRDFPHRVLEAERETLLEYDCGIAF